jgi:hypothetical protein
MTHNVPQTDSELGCVQAAALTLVPFIARIDIARGGRQQHARHTYKVVASSDMQRSAAAAEVQPIAGNKRV